jgi:hypothetical protein
MNQKVYIVYDDSGSREDYQPLYMSNSAALAKAWMNANQYNKQTDEGYQNLWVFESEGEFI